MFKLLRITLFALPLAGGVAWAQGSGTSGSSGAPGSAVTGGTNDTRTPLQQKAGRIDDTNPALPGDATKPVDVPNTVQDSNRTGMPESTDKKTDKKRTLDHKNLRNDESTLERKSDSTSDTTKTENKLDADTQKDQLNSDK